MRTDLLLDENNDLLIGPDGDFVIGASAEQEVDLLLKSNKGDWKENPAIGLNISDYYLARTGMAPIINNVTRFKRALALELQADGHDSPEISVNSDLSDFKISINP